MTRILLSVDCISMSSAWVVGIASFNFFLMRGRVVSRMVIHVISASATAGQGRAEPVRGITEVEVEEMHRAVLTHFSCSHKYTTRVCFHT